MKKKGHKVKRVVCPEKKFKSSKEEKAYKLGIINSGDYDLVIELHCNASVSSDARGCEVLYKSEKGKKYAKDVQEALATIFRDRGIKQKDDLYILNGTKPTAILLETFFCTNKADYKLAKGLKNRTKLAKIIAKSL